MNLSKWIALGSLAATVSVVGSRAADAQVVCGDQPNMQHAASVLRGARQSLDKAEDDKGGWRARAIQATETAIRETENGCASADSR
jgi:hypothetical protein